MKRHLQALILRTRGGQVSNLVLATIQQMSNAEAEQWYRLLHTMEEDARAEGARQGAKMPWKYGR